MSSPTVLNSSAALNGKTLLLAETSANISGGLIPTADTVQVGWLLRKTTTMIDATIKTLPTSGVTLVTAPAAGQIISWAWVDLFSKFAGGAYTALNATYCALQVGLNSAISLSGTIVNDSTTTPALTTLTRLMGAAARHARLVPYLEAAGGGGEQYIIPCNADGTVGIDTTASGVAQPLVLFADNNGANFTGGNAANTLTAVVYYTIVTVP